MYYIRSNAGKYSQEKKQIKYTILLNKDFTKTFNVRLYLLRDFNGLRVYRYECQYALLRN